MAQVRLLGRDKDGYNTFVAAWLYLIVVFFPHQHSQPPNPSEAKPDNNAFASGTSPLWVLSLFLEASLFPHQISIFEEEMASIPKWTKNYVWPNFAIIHNFSGSSWWLKQSKYNYLMKLLNNFLLVIFSRYLKPFIKCLSRTKYFWQQEIQKCPQLMEIVLQLQYFQWQMQSGRCRCCC